MAMMGRFTRRQCDKVPAKIKRPMDRPQRLASNLCGESPPRSNAQWTSAEWTSVNGPLRMDLCEWTSANGPLRMDLSSWRYQRSSEERRDEESTAFQPSHYL
jgi:hypothetical protein